MTTALPPTTSDGLVDQAAEEFFDALGRADEQHAVDIATGLLDAGATTEQVLLRLVGGAQERVGLLWQTAEWSVAQEHAATAVNERVVAAVGARTRGTAERGHVVLGCLDGEWHTLPGRIVAEVLRVHGWRVTFLGASVPAAHLVSYLHLHGPDVVAVSCALPAHLPTAHQTIIAAQRTGTPVLAGGAGFGAQGRWARRLGVDAWAGTAAEAAALLDRQPWAAPAPAGEGFNGPEYAGLTERRRRLIGSAVARLHGFSPLAGPHDHPPDAGVEDDIAQVLDFLAAAVYLTDRDLFVEYLGWLAGVLEARNAPAAGLDAVLEVFHAGLHDFPFAQDCLADGRTLLAGSHPGPATGRSPR